MKPIVAMLSLAALLASAASAKAQIDGRRGFDRRYGFDGRHGPGFKTHNLAADATHILVVNRHGSVVDVWKGDVRLGEIIPIHVLANLTITQSKRGENWGGMGFSVRNGSIRDRFGGGLPPFLSFSASSSSEYERMILFLVKSDEPDPTHGLLNGWRPASEDGFEHSMACVPVPGDFFHENGVWSSSLSSIPDCNWCSSEEWYKEGVLKELNRPLLAEPKK